jgi:hypothetical protein
MSPPLASTLLEAELQLDVNEFDEGGLAMRTGRRKSFRDGPCPRLRAA